jgi:hypothetical protein
MLKFISWPPGTYIYICMYIYSYVYICIYVCIHLYINIYIYIFKNMYVYVQIYVYKYRWTKSVDLFDMDYVLVPINLDLHWSLTVIVRPGKCENKCENKYVKVYLYVYICMLIYRYIYMYFVYDYALVPINLNLHWSLTVIVRPGINKHVIFYMNVYIHKRKCMYQEDLFYFFLLIWIYIGV